MPLVAIAYEIDPSANRVTWRRSPNVKIEKDVRNLTIEVIRGWRYAYPSLEEIQVWGGFPCAGLSAVRAGRRNLEDPQGALFWELLRVIKTIRQVFGFNFRAIYAAENVASMDIEVVPIHRPRFCWTNTELTPMGDVQLEEKARWIEVQISGDYPMLDQWLEKGASWPGFDWGTVLPTCMKSIRRASPPLKPAGLDRVDNDTRLRWIADEYRFLPYQYAERFLVWVGNKWWPMPMRENFFMGWDGNTP